jgi:hypothetical protein
MLLPAICMQWTRPHPSRIIGLKSENIFNSKLTLQAMAAARIDDTGSHQRQQRQQQQQQQDSDLQATIDASNASLCCNDTNAGAGVVEQSVRGGEEEESTSSHGGEDGGAQPAAAAAQSRSSTRVAGTRSRTSNQMGYMYSDAQVPSQLDVGAPLRFIALNCRAPSAAATLINRRCQARCILSAERDLYSRTTDRVRLTEPGRVVSKAKQSNAMQSKAKHPHTLKQTHHSKPLHSIAHRIFCFIVYRVVHCI